MGARSVEAAFKYALVLFSAKTKMVGLVRRSVLSLIPILRIDFSYFSFFQFGK